MSRCLKCLSVVVPQAGTGKSSASSALCCWMRHAFGLIWMLFLKYSVYYHHQNVLSCEKHSILRWYVFRRPAQTLVPCSSPTSRCRTPARTCVSAATISVPIALPLKSQCTKVSCPTRSAEWETNFRRRLLFSAWVGSNGYWDPTSGNYMITNHNLIFAFALAFIFALGQIKKKHWHWHWPWASKHNNFC